MSRFKNEVAHLQAHVKTLRLGAGALFVVALLLVATRREGTNWGAALHEVLTGRSVLLLAGGLIMGLLASEESFQKVEPFFVELFTGLLVLFLLDMGATAAARLRESRSLTRRIVVFAAIAPFPLGVTGVAVGLLAGLSVGGAAVLGAMTASASYIAAPAAVRTALPDADVGMSLGAALGVTFPVNLAVGIPVYFALACGMGA